MGTLYFVGFVRQYCSIRVCCLPVPPSPMTFVSPKPDSLSEPHFWVAKPSRCKSPKLEVVTCQKWVLTFTDKSFHEYYVNDLCTTTCSGVQGHRRWYQSNCFELR